MALDYLKLPFAQIFDEICISDHILSSDFVKFPMYLCVITVSVIPLPWVIAMVLESCAFLFISIADKKWLISPNTPKVENELKSNCH